MVDAATNVLFGWTWPQIGVGLAGLVMVVGGAAAGMVLPLMLAGGVVMAYGLIRYEGLSLMAWTYVWLAWRRRVRDGSTRWSASPLASGRPAGVLGVWGQVESRAQVVEGSGVEVVGTPFHGACYLFDPERRRATAVLALKVEEWTLSTDASKSSRAAALNDLTARLADSREWSSSRRPRSCCREPRPRRICPTMAGRRSGCAVIWRNCGPCRRS